jgi:hypothetical protein
MHCNYTGKPHTSGCMVSDFLLLGQGVGKVFCISKFVVFVFVWL